MQLVGELVYTCILTLQPFRSIYIRTDTEELAQPKGSENILVSANSTLDARATEII